MTKPHAARSPTRQRRALRPLRLAAALIAIGYALPASALDYVWLGGTGSWTDATKWSLLGLPGAGDTAVLNGSSHAALLNDTRSLGSLLLSSGQLGGSGTLNTGSASFGSATLGWSVDAAEGTVNVAGAASFNGANNQSLRYGQVVNLNGNSSWSVGNGRLEVGPAYVGNASTPAHRVSQLNIAAGTTFTDAGATAAGGTKQIGYNGGEVNNAGTYVRNGLGTTVGNYGFNNLGTLQINAGTFSLDGGGSLRSRSSGRINVVTGATLNLGNADITAGAINNDGRVTMTSNSVATLAADVATGGVWELSHSSAQLQISGNQYMAALAVTSGYVGGSGVINAASASFGSAVLGWSVDAAEGTINVAGLSSFNGAANQSLVYGQVVNLNGNSSWSAGNGRLQVSQAYAGNASTPAHRVSQLNIATGTTFTDAGAAAAAGIKQIGYNGGEVNNAGTYVRNGLGTTAGNYGFNNLGTLQINAGTFSLDGGGSLRSKSSGQINVAAGATLNLGDADITAGAINNAGRVTMIGSGVATLAAGAATGGAWELSHSSAQLQISGNQNMASLAVTNGYVGGSGVINTGSASFGSTYLGWSNDAAEGTINVAGAASFNGANNQSLRYGQVVNLNGNSSWSVGNGRLEVGQAYAGNASTPAHRVSQLNIAAGTSFTDAGAAAAAGIKQIGYNGGEVNNAGTYVRNGLGATVFTGAVTNTGTVMVNAGQLTVDDAFRNLGVVNIAAGAVLKGSDFVFNNLGTLQGTGTVQTRSDMVALNNLGSINPGSMGTGGVLSVAGDLTLGLTSTLNIDLVGLGLNDQLRVSDDLRAGGTLAVWAAGYSLKLGDSFVIASFDQLAGGTSFSSVTWNGLAAKVFDVVYNANDITLRVTAVPEPQSWLLLLGGLAAVGGWRRRARRTA